MIISRKRYQTELEKAYQDGMNNASREAGHQMLHARIDRSLEEMDKRLRKVEKRHEPAEGHTCRCGENAAGTLPI